MGGAQLPAQGADVDAAVSRLEGLQAPHPLLELPRGGHWAPPACLVPGDRDMNEPLVEVALCRRGPAPHELELLVGLEVAAGANVIKSCLVRVSHAL